MARVDVIVVGLGAMGSSVTLQLVKRGLRVTGVDRFSPPHDRGSSHGETRITRLALGEGTTYVPLVRRSHEIWREIERDAGTRLLNQTGGLVIARPGNAFLEETRAAADEWGIPHENLLSGELERRFPMFRPRSDTEAYFEPQAGFVRPERALSAELSLAERAGAELRLDEPVLSWEASSSGVSVTTATGTFEAQELVLCAGAWITKLFPDGGELFAVYPQLIHWFAVGRGYDELRTMPVFVWEMGGEIGEFTHADAFYGFPAVDGPRGGLKLGAETYDSTVDPDEPRQADLADAAREVYEQCVAPYFPWLAPERLRTMSCLYTITREGRFIIDRHPAHDNVMIVSACSGHGFKHSPAIGEAVAQLIVEGRSEIDLAPFQFAAA
jgi:sarcosine oxidase